MLLLDLLLLQDKEMNEKETVLIIKRRKSLDTQQYTFRIAIPYKGVYMVYIIDRPLFSAI